MTIEGTNPFRITTPEDLSALEMNELFVDVYSDFYQLTSPGHVFLKGPRGVGKSMMLRFLQPDCQCINRNKSIEELPFIGFYIPLKNTNFKIAELLDLENKHASVILNEHLMISHCLVVLFDSLLHFESFDNDKKLEEFIRFYNEHFVYILEQDNELDASNVHTSRDVIQLMFRQISNVYRKTIKYIKSSGTFSPYTGELYDYMDYFLPLVEELVKVISDNTATVFLLLDDAHFLSSIQTKILNSWVATRTSRKISLKISTQYNYKNYYTVNGASIDSPHDYIEVDMATVYTVKTNNTVHTYNERVRKIVQKRLDLYNIPINVDDFFPCDEKQEVAIKKIEEQYNARFDSGNGRGTNRTDDARRNARPDYIKSLGGMSKSSSTYSYSGFNQLVNISSGQVRFFLQNAYAMYAKMEANSETSSNGQVKYISPGVQNSVVRDDANNFLFKDLEGWGQIDSEDESIPYRREDVFKLSQLINGLGALFREILLSTRTERRVFSIAITDAVSAEVNKILSIGIDLGYFHQSTIGRKNGDSVGRVKLYVLNRRLAPVWNLDPNGFAGYFFMSNQEVEKLMEEPIKMAISLANRGKNIDPNQISLFDNLDKEENFDPEDCN